MAKEDKRIRGDRKRMRDDFPTFLGRIKGNCFLEHFVFIRLLVVKIIYKVEKKY